MDLVPGKNCLLGFQVAASSLCPHVAGWWVGGAQERVLVFLCHLTRTVIPSCGSYSRDFFLNLITSQRPYLQDYHIGVRASACGFVVQGHVQSVTRRKSYSYLLLRNESPQNFSGFKQHNIIIFQDFVGQEFEQGSAVWFFSSAWD